MAKELSLETLMQSSTGNAKKSKPVEEAKSPATGPIATPQNTGKTFRPISTDKLGKQQLERHPEYAEAKAKAEQAVTAPIVESAFAAMESTIEERKKGIEENLVPILEKNAEEMANEVMETGTISDDDVPEEIKENIRRAGNTPVRPKTPQELKAEKSQPKQTVETDIDEDLFAELDDDEPIEEVTTDMAEPKPDEIQYTNIQANNPVAARLAEQMSTDNEEDKNTLKKAESESDSQDTVAEVKAEDKPVTVSVPVPTPDTGEDLDELMKDLGINSQVDLDDIEEESTEEVQARFKENLSNVKIIKNPIDLGTFKIRQTATASSAVLNKISQKDDRKRSDWVLYYSGRAMTFEECKGPELDNLNKTINASNGGANAVIAVLQFIYKHTVDANKPKFEQWTKLIRTEDIESLYFGLYKACYTDSNLVPRTCPSCKKSSLIDCDIMDMVKFKDDATKKKFMDILREDTTTHTKQFNSTLLQISDDIVISYSEPTIYKTFIQFASLKQEVIDKYSETLNLMAYIDNFFAIDRATGELVPMEIKEYPNDLGKTVLSKLKVFIAVLKSLNNDQFSALRGKLNNILKDEDEYDVTYIYPELECPECHAKIPEAANQGVMNMLFTRAQLTSILAL